MTKKKLGISRGFTLIELMIVISVLGILSVASTELFYRTLRATNRAESIAEVDRMPPVPWR